MEICQRRYFRQFAAGQKIERLLEDLGVFGRFLSRSFRQESHFPSQLEESLTIKLGFLPLRRRREDYQHCVTEFKQTCVGDSTVAT